ncbi:type II toxin-antitoxin system HipA family toxin [Herbiconiux daphne]|uniref:Type II toxin-antitoxin system HipA family toxin n=1 Tax=Herbiconiux daphne TaxID=2970914 RepID=A0ABT2H2N3_9MICO|nr:type II toxin-antitoxin system HipA family toxin [Herbiconiux daphne]MCS5734177.1 type II toxin-antitoxin system HipA family toxin [Herbiconiux daphne]
MAFAAVSVIEVRAWDRLVGALALDSGTGYFAFEYDPDWVDGGVELAPLSTPLERRVRVYTGLPEPTFHRLPPFIADALPDDFGNALVTAYLASNGVERSSITALDRLAYLGHRGMGALEFRPTRGPQRRKPTALELSDLVVGARSALSGRIEGDREAAAALANLIQVGTSAGGARAKAIIAWNPASGEVRSGQLPAEDGFEQWMIKLDGVGRDTELGSSAGYGRIEYAYYLMATAAGIEMSTSRLLEENGRAHFMTKRFERREPGGTSAAASGGRRSEGKVHMQTLCAMGELDYKQRATHDYAQYFQVIDALGLDETQRTEAFRRMVFNVLARNCDDHTKNFAFLLDPPESGGVWRLAPAYDVTYAFNPSGQWTYQHLMSVNGSFADIGRADLLAVADRFQIADRFDVITQVADAIARWPEFAEQAGLTADDVDRIRQSFPAL